MGKNIFGDPSLQQQATGVVNTVCVSPCQHREESCALTSVLRGEPRNVAVGGVRVGGAVVLAPAALSAQIPEAQALSFPAARVMVLQAGRIVEYDSPEELLKKQGVFSAMAKDAGITNIETTVL